MITSDIINEKFTARLVRLFKLSKTAIALSSLHNQTPIALLKLSKMRSLLKRP
ncbi:MAG: hypothetical protein KA717_30750 [Woronichinia naegeliana WA131]|uniref:Uncharacterized protein n=1 Tax=Woronichinia naegeliana WA131 TaxID=2824559 RepID=A0A977KX48_9CYAN|nr:MAG: hypothetical protein KA717_30750 [Woronichinia naegeliana WA131]